MKKFISIIVLILVIIGLVIGLGYSWNLIINKDKQISALNQENTDLKNTITNLNNTIENIQQDSKVEEKNDAIVEESNTFFDESKIENKQDSTNVVEDISDFMGVLSVSVDTEQNTLTLDLDKNLAKLVYGYTGEGETHTIAGFSKKIVDAKIAIVGTEQKDLKVVLLMEDGSIKYIDINNILDKSYTVKTIEDSKDYVKILKVKIKDEQKGSIKYSIIALKKDGTSKILDI